MIQKTMFKNDYLAGMLLAGQIHVIPGILKANVGVESEALLAMIFAQRVPAARVRG